MELKEVHNCKKCQGKIVCISIDNVGVTRCAYCNEVVNYLPYFKGIEAQRVLDELKWRNHKT